MSKRMLVEVHVGKRYGISRLNCDGAGQVKDVIIDNERYNRISSQSKKKVWRENLEKRLERLNGDSMEHVYRTRAMKDIFKKEFLKKKQICILKMLTLLLNILSKAFCHALWRQKMDLMLQIRF